MRDITQAILKRPWVVLLVPLILVVPAVAVSFLQTPVYEAAARVQVGLGPGVDEQANMEGAIAGLQTLTREIAAAGLTPSMSEEVIKRIEQQGATQGVTEGDLNNNLTVEQVEGTRQLVFFYRDADPEQAREVVKVVNLVADVYAREIPQTYEIGIPITARVMNYAPEPKVKVPDPLRNGLKALAIGLAVGIGLALLMEQSTERR
jgi:capsular polysaccharide biosynthesis protein